MDNSEHKRKQKKMDANIKKQNGKQKKFKKYFNCEYDPLIIGDIDEDVIIKVQPLPLHTLLLGPVNHIMKSLRKKYPGLKKKVDDLHIQKSKYFGKTFEGA